MTQILFHELQDRCPLCHDVLYKVEAESKVRTVDRPNRPIQAAPINNQALENQDRTDNHGPAQAVLPGLLQVYTNEPSQADGS